MPASHDPFLDRRGPASLSRGRGADRSVDEPPCRFRFQFLSRIIASAKECFKREAKEAAFEAPHGARSVGCHDNGVGMRRRRGISPAFGERARRRGKRFACPILPCSCSPVAGPLPALLFIWSDTRNAGAPFTRGPVHIVEGRDAPLGYRCRNWRKRFKNSGSNICRLRFRAARITTLPRMGLEKSSGGGQKFCASSCKSA